MNSMPTLPQLVKAAVYTYPRWIVVDYSDQPRPFFSLAVCDGGIAEYASPDGDFTLGTGDLLLIPQNSTYSVRWGAEGCQLSAIHFYLNDDRFRYHLQRLDAMPGEGDAIRHAVRAYTDGTDPFAAAARFYDACGMFWPRLVREARPRIDARIRPAVDFLERFPEEPVKVAALAEKCRLSEPHFYACFRAATGTSPIEYRRRVLIQRGARMLIESPERPVSEIAEALGFSSETYFRRVFLSQMGCPPREYRRRQNGI